MPLILGTDEAGYGPNLGPLVVSASVWQVPEKLPPADLYRTLRRAVTATAAEARQAGSACVAIADSKALYQSGKGLALLERGLLIPLAAIGHRPPTWRAAWDALTSGGYCRRPLLPWYAGYDRELPVGCQTAEIEAAAAHFCETCERAEVRLLALRSRPVFEDEFNELVDRHESKGAVLSHITLGLVAELLQGREASSILVVCDKHGGRNCYADLLGQHFSDAFIEIHGESRQRSTYRFGPSERRIEFRFEAQGEANLPAALASMASKYLRELGMMALNAFWSARVPGLAETAGYPGDAGRFKSDIAAAQAALGIPDAQVWRKK